jgi:hypothetical protein
MNDVTYFINHVMLIGLIEPNFEMYLVNKMDTYSS